MLFCYDYSFWWLSVMAVDRLALILYHIDMDVIVLNVFLPFVGGGDVGFGGFDEIAPADAADIGVLATPNGGTDIADALVLCLAVEHIVSHNAEDSVVVIDGTAFFAAGTSLQIIVIGAIYIWENDC